MKRAGIKNYLNYCQEYALEAGPFYQFHIEVFADEYRKMESRQLNWRVGEKMYMLNPSYEYKGVKLCI